MFQGEAWVCRLSTFRRIRQKLKSLRPPRVQPPQRCPMTAQGRTILNGAGGRRLRDFRNKSFEIGHVAARLLGSSAVMPQSRERRESLPPAGRLAAIILLIPAFVGSISATAEAAGNHRGRAAAGTGAAVRQYKLDGELTRRAERLSGTTRAIVTL